MGSWDLSRLDIGEEVAQEICGRGALSGVNGYTMTL